MWLGLVKRSEYGKERRRGPCGGESATIFLDIKRRSMTVVLLRENKKRKKEKNFEQKFATKVSLYLHFKGSLHKTSFFYQ